tara:strand:+ start:274 stop:495 length:222 start_codon:yes stop_codon:yes gene_type:complete
MSPIASLKSECRWIALVSIVIITLSGVLWFAARDLLPKTIRIASAHEGELYYEAIRVFLFLFANAEISSVSFQ